MASSVDPAPTSLATAGTPAAAGEALERNGQIGQLARILAPTLIAVLVLGAIVVLLLVSTMSSRPISSRSQRRRAASPARVGSSRRLPGRVPDGPAGRTRPSRSRRASAG